MEVCFMRPNLTKDISIDSFRDYYWLKEELQSFCRENEISASGSKIDISDRNRNISSDGRDKEAYQKFKSK